MYKVKQDRENIVVAFTKIVKGIGFRIRLGEANQEQLKILYDDTDAKEHIEKTTNKGVK